MTSKMTRNVHTELSVSFRASTSLFALHFPASRNKAD